MRAETRNAAQFAIAQFEAKYGAKYPEAVASLHRDETGLLATAPPQFQLWYRLEWKVRRSAAVHQRRSRYRKDSVSLSELGNLGEFVGALAVLVSLIYLALQIRSNTGAVRASTFQNVTAGWQQNLQFAADPGVASLMERARERPEDLDRTELSRLFFLSRAMFRLCENDYYQFRNGTFDADAWSGYQNSIVDEVVGRPALRAMWSIQRDVFSRTFVEFMDEQAQLSRDREKAGRSELQELWESSLRKEGVS